MQKTYFMFIRIGEEKYIDLLQKKGHIYCNTIRYFRSIENDNNRGDKNEGKVFIKQAKNLEVLVKGEIIGIAEKAQIYFDNDKNTGNIFCIYGVESSTIDQTIISRQKVLIEEESRDFGKAALLIFDIQEFLNRISESLKALRKEFKIEPVYYFDPNTYQGKLNPYFKSNKYKHQNEVRLLIQNTEEEPFEFYIGDISDISRKIPVSDLNKIEVEVINPNN